MIKREKILDIMNAQALHVAEVGYPRDNICIHENSTPDDFDWMIRNRDFVQNPKPFPNGGIIDKNKMHVFYVETVGGEGMGDYYSTVYVIEHPDFDGPVYIQYTGHYDSWNGVDWYTPFTIVEPVQVMVTQFREVQQ